MTELPVMPLWDVLYLDGIALVLGGCLAALVGEAQEEPEPWDDLPPLADPYAEI